MRAWCVSRRWPLLVWGAILAWSLSLFATARTAYASFQLSRYDLGTMVQAVWSTAHGRPLEVTDATGEQMIRLGSHVDPILALFAPLWMLAPGAAGARPIGFHATLPPTRVDAPRAAVSLVPEGAPVTATNGAGSQLSARRYFYSVPTIRRAEWILLDTWSTWMPPSKVRAEGLHPELLRAFLNRIQARLIWRQIFERDGVVVFQRVPSG